MRRRFILAGVSLAVVLLALAGVVIYYELREPPLAKFQRAVTSLEEARAAGADRWATGSYRAAEELADEGKQAIAQVSGNWWPFGSYRYADSLLGESIRLSAKARSEAEHKRTDRKKSVEQEVRTLRDSLNMWRDRLDYSLPRVDNELTYRAALFSLNLAEDFLERDQYGAARECADSIRIVLDNLLQRHGQQVSSTNRWVERSREWIARTLTESKASGSTALVVDKSKHVLYVMKSGRLTDSIACELGYNSGYQKRFAGDGATPEGKYRVTHVNLASKYYRALLLDYPNADDRERFRSNLEAGSIAADAKIGGLIEVHGHGGKGSDWTDGCVAVTDRAMDDLLRLAKVGTTVTIVREWSDR